ncbi:MAG: alpha/beta hydrolase [Angelakisella sp.]
MKVQTNKLATLFPALQNGTATLTSYLLENQAEFSAGRVRRAVVICPGGGYAYTSAREAEPIALQFLANDIVAFVLDYSVAPIHYPQQLLEASAAVAWVRRNSATLSIDPNDIAICGFSAGGHLAASLGTMWQEEFLAEQLGLAPGENRPDRMILGYPVISGSECRHAGSFTNLLGVENDLPAVRDQQSPNLRVTANCCPAFIWATAQDSCVPAQSSLLLALAMAKQGIRYELVVYSSGEHGLSLANKITAAPQDNKALLEPRAAGWVQQCLSWWEELDGQ